MIGSLGNEGSFGIEPDDKEITRQFLSQPQQLCTFATTDMPGQQPFVGFWLSDAVLQTELQELKQAASRVIFLAIDKESSDILRTNLPHRIKVVDYRAPKLQCRCRVALVPRLWLPYFVGRL